MPATWTWNQQTEDSLAESLPSERSLPVAELATSLTPTASFAQILTAAATPEAASPQSGVALQQEARVWAVVERSPWLMVGLRCWRGLRARFAGGPPVAVRRPSMQVLSNLALGGRKTITLIEVDGQRYLVGAGAESVTAMVAIRTDDTVSEGQAFQPSASPRNDSPEEASRKQAQQAVPKPFSMPSIQARV